MTFALKPFDERRVSCGLHLHESERDASNCLRGRVKSNGQYFCSHCKRWYHPTHARCNHEGKLCCEVDVPVEA